jgi:hypothetical protein
VHSSLRLYWSFNKILVPGLDKRKRSQYYRHTKYSGLNYLPGGVFMISKSDFLSDNQGAKFKDVNEDSRFSFQDVIDFFNDETRRIRLCDSEIHHDRPALAGVIKEFEAQPSITLFFETSDGHTTQRFRQGVGVLVRLHMQQMGWHTTGRKGSLGTRAKTLPHTSDPGAYQNNSGLSKWFTRAERYEKN